MARHLPWLLALILLGCTQPHRATHALQVAGFTNIKILGPAYGRCSDWEDFGADFVADIEGHAVLGVVCHEPGGQDVVRFRKSEEAGK